jgi:hypothetical protein
MARTKTTGIKMVAIVFQLDEFSYFLIVFFRQMYC